MLFNPNTDIVKQEYRNSPWRFSMAQADIERQERNREKMVTFLLGGLRTIKGIKSNVSLPDVRLLF